MNGIYNFRFISTVDTVSYGQRSRLDVLYLSYRKKSNTLLYYVSINNHNYRIGKITYKRAYRILMSNIP